MEGNNDQINSQNMNSDPNQQVNQGMGFGNQGYQ